MDVLLFADFMDDQTRQMAVGYLPKLQSAQIRHTTEKALDEIIHAQRRLSEKVTLLKKSQVWEEQSAQLVDEDPNLMSYEHFPEAAREVIKALKLRASLVRHGKREYYQPSHFNAAHGRSIDLRETFEGVSCEEDDLYADQLAVMIGDADVTNTEAILIS